MANVVDLAYAAGIIDGEGTIGITALNPNEHRRPNGMRVRKSVQHRIYMAVTMTDAAVPMWLHSQFGGNIQHVPGTLSHHKPSLRWSMSSKRAADFCAEVLPFLKVKRMQAELAISFYEKHLGPRSFQGHTGVSSDELSKRQEFVYQIRALNRRGVAVGA